MQTALLMEKPEPMTMVKIKVKSTLAAPTTPLTSPVPVFK